MHYFPIFLLILVGLVLIARPFTVLFHELGHAIPALLLTRQKVTIYLGSYGNPERSIKFNLGALVIFFRYNPFAWRLGLCVPSANTVSLNKQIAYTLTGPLASLTIAAISCYFAFTYDLNGFLKLFLIVFLGSAFIDLLVNLIPDETPIKLYDGRITYNDGYSLKQLFYFKRLPKEYTEAANLYNAERYGDAAILFEKFLLNGIEDENVYRLAISSNLKGLNYENAKKLSDAFRLIGTMNSDDLSNSALSYSQLGFHERALEVYDESLKLNPDNKYSLNNKGYTLNLVDKFEEAIFFFDKAIEIDKDFAYSYNNRGFAKIKLGRTEEGLQDIKRSFILDPNNSYAYRNLGIYHFDKEEFDEALSLFEKAKKLDASTHLIDDLINETSTKLSVGKDALTNAGLTKEQSVVR